MSKYEKIYGKGESVSFDRYMFGAVKGKFYLCALFEDDEQPTIDELENDLENQLCNVSRRIWNSI